MVDEFIRNVDEYHDQSKECDMYFLYQGFTLDTICKSAMGVNFEIQKNLETDKLLKQVRSMLAFGMNVVVILIGELELVDTLEKLVKIREKSRVNRKGLSLCT